MGVKTLHNIVIDFLTGIPAQNAQKVPHVTQRCFIQTTGQTRKKR